MTITQEKALLLYKMYTLVAAEGYGKMMQINRSIEKSFIANRRKKTIRVSWYTYEMNCSSNNVRKTISYDKGLFSCISEKD